MKKKFSAKWNASKQPRKQRKYYHNAPLHIKGSFLNSHLSKELAKKHKIRSIRLRAGDRVKVLRGSFKGKENKVDLIDVKTGRVAIAGIEISKKDGSKSRPFIHASNLLITEINTDDKRRLNKTIQTKKKD